MPVLPVIFMRFATGRVMVDEPCRMSGVEDTTRANAKRETKEEGENMLDEMKVGTADEFTALI